MFMGTHRGSNGSRIIRGWWPAATEIVASVTKLQTIQLQTLSTCLQIPIVLLGETCIPSLKSSSRSRPLLPYRSPFLGEFSHFKPVVRCSQRLFLGCQAPQRTHPRRILEGPASTLVMRLPCLISHGAMGTPLGYEVVGVRKPKCCQSHWVTNQGLRQHRFPFTLW